MIVVYGIDNRLSAIKVKLSDVIHDCMQTVLGLPEGKRAHRFIGLGSTDFYYPEDRSDAYTVIEINMMAGRSIETKKTLILTLFSSIEAELAINPMDIEITIQEQEPHCWGFRGTTGDAAMDLGYEIKI